MQSFSQGMNVRNLIEELDDYMVSLGYTENSLRHYRQAWKKVYVLAQEEGVEHFSKDFAFHILRDHYKIEPYEKITNGYKLRIRRSIMLLLEYDVSKTIVKQLPKNDYDLPAGFQEAGIRFLSELGSLNLTRETIYTYQKQIYRAAVFFVNHGVSDFKHIDNELIILYLKTFLGCSRHHISNNIRSLSRFFEFACKNGYTDKTFDFPKVTVYKERRVPEYYSAEEISKILSAVDRGNALGKRNYAMILLAVRYGLRVSDIISLRLHNLDFENNRICINQKKTGNPLVLDLLPDVGWALIDYLKNGRPKVECQNVFLRHRHPYDAFTEGECMQKMLQRYALSAGVWKVDSEKHCGFHMLRYSLASDLIQQGVSLTTISGILGHSEINITTHYTQFDIKNFHLCG